MRVKSRCLFSKMHAGAVSNSSIAGIGVEPLSGRNLEAPFRNTSYVVHLGDANIVLRVGQHSPQLDELLAQHGCEAWAWVTPANPGAQKVTENINATRYRDCLSYLGQARISYLATDAVPDNLDWPIEPGFFLFGVSIKQALQIGKQFGQLAILAGNQHQTPTLYYCDREQA